MGYDSEIERICQKLEIWSVIGENKEIDGVYTVQGIWKYAKGVIITKLSCNMLGNLAMGCGGETEEFIISQLMKGNRVLIDGEGIEYKKYKKSSPYYRQFSDYERLLITRGAEYLPCSKKLVGASDLKGVTRLRLRENSVITPLALDIIKENNIEVEYGYCKNNRQHLGDKKR